MSEYIIDDEWIDNFIAAVEELTGSAIEYDGNENPVPPLREIVRCRDCIYMHTVRNWLGMDMGECWLRADRESGALGKERTEPDGFCAWAIKRKEDGDDR